MSDAENATNFGAQRVLMAALSHDLAEHITGDMPGDAKREMGMREVFSEFENALLMQVGLDFESQLSVSEKRVVKMADMMEGAFHCISEASLGNARIGIVFRNFRAYIASFAPFSETEGEIVDYIDELWQNYGVNSAPGWTATAHTEESMQNENITGDDNLGLINLDLIDELRREEAEGRATPPPCDHKLAEYDMSKDEYHCPCGMVRDGYEQPWRYPSTTPKTGDVLVTEQVQKSLSDDRAPPELAPKPSMPANARQYGGDHYKGTGYEHWDLVLDTGMNYFQGCATKYVTRARKHDGGAVLNLKKAIHYVDKIQEAQAEGRIRPENYAWSSSDVERFVAANQLNEREGRVIRAIIGWEWDAARAGLMKLLDEQRLPMGAQAAQDDQ